MHFRGSNSAILNFATLVSGVQLLLKVQIFPLSYFGRVLSSEEEKRKSVKSCSPL